MSRKAKVARNAANWHFSLIGNEAENLRDACGNVDYIAADLAPTILRFLDDARAYWLRGDDWLSLAELCTASRAFGHAQAAPDTDTAAFRRKFAREAAAAKSARDPKQAAKAGALALWKERHAGKHRKLRTVEQFATEVMRRWPVLTSTGTIEKWSASWTKDAAAGREPSLRTCR